MSAKFVILSVVCAVALAKSQGGNGNGGGQGGGMGGGRGGNQQGGQQGPPPPPFLANVTDAGRQAFFAIVSNSSLTITEITTQTAAWATTYGVSDIYTEFTANQTALQAEITKNITTVISNLASVESSLETIFNNKDQTRAAINSSISTLSQTYPVEVQVLLQLRHPRPQGGQGGQGGFGGQQGGFGGGRGNFGGNFNANGSTGVTKKTKKSTTASSR